MFDQSTPTTQKGNNKDKNLWRRHGFSGRGRIFLRGGVLNNVTFGGIYIIIYKMLFVKEWGGEEGGY